jgi:glutaminase
MTDDSKHDDLAAIVQGMKTMASPLRSFLQTQHATHKALHDGSVADSLPELAKANPQWFGICVVDVSGKVYEVGDSSQSFTIQALAHPFVYGLALENYSRDQVLKQTTMKPMHDSLDVRVRDEVARQLHDPLNGAGAIATFSMITGNSLTNRLNRLLDMFGCYVGREMLTDAPTFVSARMAGHRSRALAHFMLDMGILNEKVDETLDLYFQQQAMLVTCRDVALMAATIANKGVNPVTGVQALKAESVKDVLSMLYTYGMQQYTGAWMYRVGLPARGSISGGLMAIVPQQLGIAVYSPPLNEAGLSVRGIQVCEAVVQHFTLHTCDAQFGGTALRDALTETARGASARSRISRALQDE